MSFVENVKPIYLLPADDLVGEVLIPAFKASDNVECMMGFFSSESLASLAPGLAAYINTSSHPFKLLVSPFIRDEDRRAIELGLKDPQEIADEFFLNLQITPSTLEEHTLKCLSYLILSGRLELQVALMKKALFHPKVWIFHNGNNKAVVHGSSNMTASGMLRNFEQISLSISWIDATQKYIAERLSFQFHRLWGGNEDDCVVVPISRAVKESLLRQYPADKPPTEDDFYKLFLKAQEPPLLQERPESLSLPPRQLFEIPDWLDYTSGDFKHQQEAVDAWCRANYGGILEMATGAGKTITAMICAHHLYKDRAPLLIIIAAPYLPLVEQWSEEISIFGLHAVNLTHVSGSVARSRELQKIRRRLRAKISDVEAVLVTHNTLCDDDFHTSIRKFECTKLLIADEVHNLGRNEFTKNLPDFFDFRLGLSATPQRQYDEEGTEILFTFFGPSVFQFTLGEAIGKCLVEYDYYVHVVLLTKTEMEDWYAITQKIKENAWRSDSKGPDDYLSKLLRDRRKLLETAQGKIKSLSDLLNEIDVRSLKHTLIYATDKDPGQLEAVNSLVGAKNILFHQLTADETQNRDQCKKITNMFQQGEIQVLTAKRVLDEGVNIPQISRAYILASTTVERQWIQRRGRLLRKCKATGKTHSEIHDFVALPPGYDQGTLDDDARTLIRSELRRLHEFASAARNAGRDDGPLPVIDKMVKAIFS